MENESVIAGPESSAGQLSGADARQAAETLLATGVPLDVVNRNLTASGQAPIEPSPPAEAERQLSALKADRAWGAKVLAGDMEANATLARLSGIIAGGEDRTPIYDPQEYRFGTAYKFPNADDSRVLAFDEGAKQWAIDLQLSPDAARSLISLHHDALVRGGAMSPAEAEQYQGRQEADFLKVVGNDPMRLTAAQNFLRIESNGKLNMDLLRISRSNGAAMALELLLHAEYRAEARKVK